MNISSLSMCSLYVCIVSINVNWIALTSDPTHVKMSHASARMNKKDNPRAHASPLKQLETDLILLNCLVFVGSQMSQMKLMNDTTNSISAIWHLFRNTRKTKVVKFTLSQGYQGYQLM
eukprot:886494_1